MARQTEKNTQKHLHSDEIDLSNLFEKDESFARYRVADQKNQHRREVRRRLDAYFEARMLKQALMDY